MPKVGINAFYKGTGTNPYDGDLKTGIDYDRYEAHSHFLEHDCGTWSSISTNYAACAKRLVQQLDAAPGSRLVDIGSGTGIATRELFLRNHNIKVTGIEISPGMRAVAQYKFGQNNVIDCRQFDDVTLIKYWEEFRATAQGNKDRVTFVNGDFRSIGKHFEGKKPIDGTIANQVIHWLTDDELNSAFRQVHAILRPRGSFAWNTAIHFYNPALYPAQGCAYNRNDIFYRFADQLRKRSKSDVVYEPPVPKHSFESLDAIASAADFTSRLVGTFINDFDFQTLLTNHLPRIGESLLAEQKVPKRSASRIIRESLAAVVTDPKAMSDTRHKYQVVPIIKSVKT